MKISATSALVLNWTDFKLWESEKAFAYQTQLDLSEGEGLYKMFSEDESYYHKQAVSGRKFFMKEQVFNFLKNLDEHEETGQVIILAAGLAPLSIEIAAKFPSCKIFDIDKYLMIEKMEIVNKNPPNIEFIVADISDLNSIKDNLISHNYDFDKPTIAVMEGIIYYLTLDDFKNILNFLKYHNIVFCGDFCLKPELINDKTRIYLTEVFRKIQDVVKLDFISYYSKDEINQILKGAGFNNINFSNMQQIQEKRTGEIFPFVEENSCWVMNVYAD